MNKIREEALEFMMNKELAPIDRANFTINKIIEERKNIIQDVINIIDELDISKLNDEADKILEKEGMEYNPVKWDRRGEEIIKDLLKQKVNKL